MAQSALAALAGAAAAFAFGGAAGLSAAILSFALVAVGMPLFRAYAMARPNARSSHRTPVPQGGGAAVVATTMAVAAVSLAMLDPSPAAMPRFLWLAAGVILVAAIGAIDDMRPVPVLPRLGVQLLAVALAIHGASAGGTVLPAPLASAPWFLEFALLVLAGAWFVNLTNFMDGIDGITLAGFMPLAAGAVALGWAGYVSAGGSLVAMSLLGALAGFAFFNVPRARLFLGDVGSLPIGLLGGALLLDAAQHGALASAIILPLYHIADATSTLARRVVRRERIWEAHRQHAYQAAVDRGWPHAAVSGVVLCLNVCLAALAVFAAGLSAGGQAIALLIAAAGAGGVILLFRHDGFRPS